MVECLFEYHFGTEDVVECLVEYHFGTEDAVECLSLFENDC